MGGRIPTCKDCGHFLGAEPYAGKACQCDSNLVTVPANCLATKPRKRRPVAWLLQWEQLKGVGWGKNRELHETYAEARRQTKTLTTKGHFRNIKIIPLYAGKDT